MVKTVPFQIVAIDYLLHEKSAGRCRFILVIMDHCLWYAQASATREKLTKITTGKLYKLYNSA